MDVPEEGKKVLAHEPVRGYRPVFFIAITIGILYLGVVLFFSL
jgi:hypothetical protein